MTPYDQAQRWLAKQPPAVSGSGGHNQTFSVACCLVHGFGLTQSDITALMADYNRSCQPPWSEHDLKHKITDAAHTQPSKPHGYMLRGSTANHEPITHEHTDLPDRGPLKPITAQGDAVLPDPLEDGARLLLRSAFLPGEGIRICNAKLNEEAREIPADSGTVLSREEWLRRLDASDGNPNGIYSSSKRTGIYVSINPMRLGGSKDSDVTAFRYALIEFDSLPREEQWRLFVGSNLPCSAVISSGGKSIHAWVRVDAKDRREYDERVKVLYDYFAGAGHAIDTKNKNPSRFSRLPSCVRFAQRQELLALNIGAESFTAWLTDLQAEGIGQRVTVDELLSFRPENDTNAVLGNRWLCKGGSCLLIGPSGVGKSSLNMQMAATWSVEQPFCGIRPHKPLKSLIIQAENDLGDSAEMLQGVYGSFPLLADAEDAQLRENLVLIRDTTHTGFEFTQAAQRLIDKHKPDLVWLDPLLSFIGADISRQEVCSQFLRTWLNPISEATGVIWMCVHHTGKPPSDKEARRGWQMSDYGYSGMGSSELTNWARAILVLRAVSSHQFELKLAKRGKRAGATQPSGEPATSLWLQHGDSSICWKQIAPPEEPATQQRKNGRPGKAFEFRAFLDTIKGEKLKFTELVVRARAFGEISRTHFCSVVLPELKKMNLQNHDGIWSVQ